jgi:hypothetical protein
MNSDLLLKETSPAADLGVRDGYTQLVCQFRDSGENFVIFSQARASKARGRSARKSRKVLRPISYLAFGGLIMICAPGVPGYISHGAPGAPGDVESPVDSGVAVLDDK